MVQVRSSLRGRCIVLLVVSRSESTFARIRGLQGLRLSAPSFVLFAKSFFSRRAARRIEQRHCSLFSRGKVRLVRLASLLRARD